MATLQPIYETHIIIIKYVIHYVLSAFSIFWRVLSTFIEYVQSKFQTSSMVKCDAVQSAQTIKIQKKIVIEPSVGSWSTRNNLREIVERVDMTKMAKDKPFISISIGDPTKYPNLPVPQFAIEAVQTALLSKKHNGYAICYGLKEARSAIANKYSLSNCPLTANDVIMTSGCCDALNISLCALLEDGDNFLTPKPGFSFYETIASRYNFKCNYYNLLPDKEWQIDTKHMRAIINKRTKAILINNPSNPCGSVLSKENLNDVLDIANAYNLPIITDEIYDGMVFDDNNGQNPFYSVASLTKRVPVLTLSSLSKQYLVPGWRVGWICVHDPVGAFSKIRIALQRLSNVIMGPNQLVQAAIPQILKETSDEYYTQLNQQLYQQATLLYDTLSAIPGLVPIKSRATMFLMVKIDLNILKGIEDDIDFTNKLLQKQAVLVLPGTIFGIKNYFRATICPPAEVIVELGKRMRSFCSEFYS